MNVRDNSLAPPAAANSTDPGATATRIEGLLAAVVAACECMVQHADLLPGLQAAVEQLGRLSGHDRAYVWELTEAQTVCVCIAEWDAPGIGRISDMAGMEGMARFAVADFMEVWAPLLAGQAYQSVTPLKTGANAVFNQTVANRSDVMLPIFVGDRCWGCIGFDNCTEERSYSPAEVQALRGAAAAVAAAVQRCDAEGRRLAMERQRADEALALNHLLEGVVQASRALLDSKDFGDGLQRWLAYLARAVEADAAMLGNLETPGPTGALTTFSSYWARDGSPQAGQPIPVTTDFVLWTERLRRGDWIWAHRDELQDPASVAFWVATDCFTNLLMPVVCDGRTVGWLGFDWRQRQAWRPAFAAALRTAADGVAAALQRQQAMQHMLAEREQRIAVEQARANEATLHTARVERHSRLLAAVAESAEELLACADPADCMGAVLARVGEVTHAERVCLARMGWTPQDPALHGWQEITHEWTKQGVARQMDGHLRRMAMRRGDASWDFVVNQLSTQGRLLVDIDSLEEPVRSEQLALGVAWTLCYPVVLEGRVWGLMGMDYATPFGDYDEADLAALQTVAATIADAQLRRRLEQRAIATERARVDEAQALNRLLESVVQSSRELLDAPDLERGLQEWLQVLALAVNADVAAIGSLAPVGESPTLANWQVHWAQPRHRNQVMPPVPVTADFMDWHARLQRGETVWARRDELLDPASVRFWQDTHCWTNLLVPIRSASGTMGILCFDWHEKREWQPAFGTVLRTAADSVAGAIQRHEATQALLAERERRIREEQVRVVDLSRANLALRTSLGALAETASAEGFLSQTLSQIAEQSGSRSAFLLRKTSTSGVFQLVGHVDGGPFRREALPHHPQRFKTGYPLDSAVEQRLSAHGRLLWQPIDAQAAAASAHHAGTEPCDMMRWHVQQGHAAHALHALAVGQRTVGLVGLTFDTAEPLSAAQEELIHALCQPMTLALELDRLARAALRSGEHAAVLTERNRLAREIHDGIAQSFLAIQMQIDSLEGAMQHLPPVARAMDLARHGLTEARRAVSALRPVDLLNRELPSGLRHLLGQMTAGSSLLSTLESPVQWSYLPPEVEDQLFRIAQEAASNVLKHAQARQLRVELSQAAGVATMLIADDGVGFDAANLAAGQGFGLESMQQRAQLIGARIQWLSQPGDGTQVLVTWGESAAPTRHPAPRNIA